jgi:hypothetical protein
MLVQSLFLLGTLSGFSLDLTSVACVVASSRALVVFLHQLCRLVLIDVSKLCADGIFINVSLFRLGLKICEVASQVMCY